tara:strand:- start:885 stop:1472 length:588 start_codon:yes stop_codon:yes gene_type:complete
MPNICENTIRIVGDTDKVNQLLADMTTDGYEGRSYDTDQMVKVYDLTRVRPMPVVFDSMHIGGRNIDGFQAKVWVYKDKDGNIVDDNLLQILTEDKDYTAEAVTDEVLDALKEEFGASDWREWRSNNWGTKWVTQVDVDNVSIEEYEGTMWVEFVVDSAWGPPHELLEFINKEYELDGLSNRWWEEGGHADWTHY